jgi:hypothetical protein
MILVLPRPASGGECRVYNLAGELVANFSFGTSAVLATDHLAQGIYLARTTVEFEDGTSETNIQKLAVLR